MRKLLLPAGLLAVAAAGFHLLPGLLRPASNTSTDAPRTLRDLKRPTQ